METSENLDLVRKNRIKIFKICNYYYDLSKECLLKENIKSKIIEEFNINVEYYDLIYNKIIYKSLTMWQNIDKEYKNKLIDKNICPANLSTMACKPPLYWFSYNHYFDLVKNINGLNNNYMENSNRNLGFTINPDLLYDDIKLISIDIDELANMQINIEEVCKEIHQYITEDIVKKSSNILKLEDLVLKNELTDISCSLVSNFKEMFKLKVYLLSKNESIIYIFSKLRIIIQLIREIELGTKYKNINDKKYTLSELIREFLEDMSSNESINELINNMKYKCLDDDILIFQDYEYRNMFANLLNRCHHGYVENINDEDLLWLLVEIENSKNLTEEENKKLLERVKNSKLFPYIKSSIKESKNFNIFCLAKFIDFCYNIIGVFYNFKTLFLEVLYVKKLINEEQFNNLKNQLL